MRFLTWSIQSLAAALGVVLTSLVLAGPLGAQGTVTGQVVDAATGVPMASVQVYLPTLDLGTLTSASGRYLIVNVPAGTYPIQAERIGFRPVRQQVTVQSGQSTQVNFQMTEEPLGLEEIVVTGTAGQARRREVGNTITQISLEQIVEPVVNMESLLQGRAPGVNIIQSSGQIGDGSKIRLRGNVSATLNNQPLIYVDGVRTKSTGYESLDPITLGQQYGTMQMSSPLNDINPDDIERIEIIKGAAATTLYGAEGSSGVIQIFTKRGRTGAPAWDLEIDQGLVGENKFGSRKSLRGTPIEDLDFAYPHGGTSAYNGLDPWFQNGWRQRYNLAVRGGTQMLRYFVSGTMENNDGLFVTEWEKRNSVRGNFGIRLSSALNLDWNTSYANVELSNLLCGNDIHGICLNAGRAPRNYISSGKKEDLDRLVYEKQALTQISRLVTGVTVGLQPTAQQTNRLTVGYDRSDYGGRLVLPYGSLIVPLGMEATHNTIEEILTVDYVSNYNTPLAGALNGEFAVGFQTITRESQEIRGHSQDFPGPAGPDLVTLSSGALTLARESRQRVITGGFFGQALFGYRDRYFLTVGMRVDGNSAFGEDFGLQAYPKVSLSYVISDEGFWPQSLGQVKLRAAYGKAGRAPGAFDAVRTWTPGAWGTQSRFTPSNRGNPGLGPENTGEFDAGFEAAWFGGRLTADFSYYNRKTTDALVNVTTPASTGGWGSQLENVGELEGKGIELALAGTVIESSRLTWDLGVDISTNYTKILDLGGAPETGAIRLGQPVPVVRGDVIRNREVKADVRRPFGCPTNLPAGTPCLETTVNLGPNTPTHIISPSTTIRLPSRILITARGEYQGGHWITDGGTRWALNTGATIPLCYEAVKDIEAGNTTNLSALERMVCIRANLRSGVFTYPADFFKLREVSIQVPVEFLIPRTKQATLTLSGRNLYRWLNEDFWNWDPEQTGWEGVNSFTNGMWEQPAPPKVFTASLRMSF